MIKIESFLKCGFCEAFNPICTTNNNEQIGRCIKFKKGDLRSKDEQMCRKQKQIISKEQKKNKKYVI